MCHPKGFADCDLVPRLKRIETSATDLTSDFQCFERLRLWWDWVRIVGREIAMFVRGGARRFGAAACCSTVTVLLAASAVGFAPTSSAASASAEEADPTQWTRKDDSVAAPPEELAAQVGTQEPARVVAVTEQDGRPVFEVFPVVGTTEAQSVVAREQDQDQTLAIDVESKQSFIASQANDSYRGRQWALSKLDAERAWSISKGAGQKVAVVDSGVSNVTDLAGQLLAGHDFVTGSGSGQADQNGHGTHVAGIIAAKANNRYGTAGLAPAAKILPVRVLDRKGQGYASDIARGIVWATDHGAGIINLSLGGTYDKSTKVAVDYAVSKRRVVVAASGNSGNGVVSYPAGFANVMAVAASTSSDGIAGFSSFGHHLDVAAPGQDILSTVPGNGFAYASGTSMASPYAAAAVALIRSAAADRQLGSVDAQRALEMTAIDIGTPGKDVTSGAGRINPYRALCFIGACAPRQHVSATVSQSKGQLTLRASTGSRTRLTVQRKSQGTWTTVSTRYTDRLGVARVSLAKGVAYRIVIPTTARTTAWTSGVLRW